MKPLPRLLDHLGASQIAGLQCGVLAMLLGGLVMFGWHGQHPVLLQGHPSFAPMQYNTALGFVLAGLGVVLVVVQGRRTAALLGALLLGLGGLTLAQYLLDIDLGIDQALMRGTVTVQTSHAGRMAPNTAVAFTMAGLAFILGLWRPLRGVSTACMALGTLVMLLGLVAIFGYLGGYEMGYGWGNWTRMAIHTAVGCVVIGIGFLTAGWQLPSDAGGVTLRHRRLLAGTASGFLLIGILGAIVVAIPLQERLREAHLNHLRSNTRSTALSVDRHLVSARTAAVMVAVLPRPRELHDLNRAGAISGEAHRHQSEAILREVMNQVEDIRGITRLGPDGEPVISLGQTVTPEHWPGLPASGTVFSAPMTVDGQSLFVAVTSLRSIGGEPMGHDVVTLAFEPVARLLVSGGEEMDGLGLPTLLVEEMNGHRHFFPEEMPLPVAVLAGLASQPTPPPSSDGVQILTTELLEERPRYVAVQSLAEPDWTLLWPLDMASAQPGLNRQVLLLVGTALLFAAFGAVLVWTVLRRMEDEAEIREKHSREIADREIRMNLALSSADAGTWQWDMRSGLITWDATMHDLHGIPRDSFPGTYEAFDHAILPEDRAKVNEAVTRAIENRMEYDTEFRIRWPDGTLHHISGKGLAFYDAEDQPVKMAGINVNIDRRKEEEARLEQHRRQLEEMNEELRARNRELDEFTYVASHDLQEPLRVISTFTDYLREDLDGELPERAEKDMGFILDASRRMQRLIQDLLALSRAGRRDLEVTEVDLDGRVDSALHSLQIAVDQGEVEVTRDSLPTIIGDPTLLTQLYQNLIGNALKFCSNDTPRLHLTAERRGDRWILGVKDNGPGIEPQYAEQIFTPFKRLNRPGDYEGTGIGLAICRKVVERHGGEIWVESEAGAGAHFRFSIPAEGKVP